MTEYLQFEWDDSKSAKTARERGLDFDRASRIFQNEVLEEEDDRKDYGEVRIRAIGKVDGNFIYRHLYLARRPSSNYFGSPGPQERTR